MEAELGGGVPPGKKDSAIASLGSAFWFIQLRIHNPHLVTVLRFGFCSHWASF